MAGRVIDYEEGAVVSITSPKGFQTEEFGEINRSNPGGPGLLRLHPGIESKYSICFIAPEGDVDTTECIWIPVPNHIRVQEVHGYGLNFPIPPTDEGVNMLRRAFQKVRGAAANVLEIGRPSPREAREQRDAPSDAKFMYITHEGMQAWDDLYNAEQERVKQIRGPERLQASQKIRQDRADILSFINEKRPDKEVHARFGDSEFHRMKADGHWSYNEEDWHYYESEEPEDTVVDSPEQELYMGEYGEYTAEPKRVFVAGEETSETRPGQDTELAVPEPEVSAVEEPIVSTNGSTPQSSKNGKRALGNIANLGRSFAIGKFAQTELGQKLGVEARTHRMLAHIPIETAVVFLSDMPELGVEKNDKGTVKLGPRGREKVVYFGEGEYVIPKQNTILGLATSAPTQATSVTAITGKWGSTATPSSILSSDWLSGIGSRRGSTEDFGLPPGFNAKYYRDLSERQRNEYLRSLGADVGTIGTIKWAKNRPTIEKRIAAALAKQSQTILTPEEAIEKRKTRAPKQSHLRVTRDAVKVVQDEDNDNRWVVQITMPPSRMISARVTEGIDMETTQWKPITVPERSMIQDVIEKWKIDFPSKVPSYEIRDKFIVGSQDQAIRDIAMGTGSMTIGDIEELSRMEDYVEPEALQTLLRDPDVRRYHQGLIFDQEKLDNLIIMDDDE